MAFLYRLLPPRPTFAQDMSSAEADVMQRHVAYWQDLLNRDVALAFGPVLDPEDPWGLGLLDLEDEHAARLNAMGERARYEPGTFCWVGLATSDPDSAKAFYTALFGWEAEDLSAGSAGTYTMLRYGGREVAILYRQQPQARAAGAPPHWTSYISVEDAGATAAKANDLGGAAVFREPFDVLDHGRVAAIRDPTGAIVSLWQPRSRVGATLVNDIGALCWNELATTDVGRAKTFFSDLLGWAYEPDKGGSTTIRNAGHRNGAI